MLEERYVGYPESLENTPVKKLEYYWADYIELLCLANPDKSISKSDFVARVKNRNTDFEDPSDDMLDEEGDWDDNSSDQWTKRTNDYFRFLTCREKLFNDFYPFYFSENKKVLNAHEEITEKHKLYIFFLFASNLRYFRDETQKLTGSFEKICIDATKIFFKGWDIHSFGVGAEVESKYHGTLWNKMASLIEDLRGKLIAEEKDFKSDNRGDGGLDIVGWKQFNDSQDGFPILFGQCACTKTWDVKQHSSNQEVWGERIKTKAPPFNLIYAPICFRNANGDWYRSDEIRKSIMVDRLRLKDALVDTESFKNSESYQIVSDLILLEESII